MHQSVSAELHTEMHRQSLCVVVFSLLARITCKPLMPCYARSGDNTSAAVSLSKRDDNEAREEVVFHHACYQAPGKRVLCLLTLSWADFAHIHRRCSVSLISCMLHFVASQSITRTSILGVSRKRTGTHFNESETDNAALWCRALLGVIEWDC